MMDSSLTWTSKVDIDIDGDDSTGGGGEVCDIFKLRDALRRRDFVSSSVSDERPRLRREGERRIAAPILEAHFAAGLCVPGGRGRAGVLVSAYELTTVGG